MKNYVFLILLKTKVKFEQPSIFFRRNKKKLYTPVNHKFCYKKVGSKRDVITQVYKHDANKQASSSNHSRIVSLN